MRLINFGDTKCLVTGNKPFCLFMILGHSIPIKEEECRLPGYLRILVSSITELEELSRLFKDHCFKVVTNVVGGGNRHEKRFFDSSSTFTHPEGLSLFIEDFDSKRFHRFLKILSREYGYKTYYIIDNHVIIK